jgi:hypothetical protein
LRQTDMQKVPGAFIEGLTEAVPYTAKWLKSSSEPVWQVRGLDTEEPSLLLLHGTQAPCGLLYRAASSVFEVHVTRSELEIRPPRPPERQKGLTWCEPHFPDSTHSQLLTF